MNDYGHGIGQLEIVRTQNPYSLSIDELAHRQIASNNRRDARGGIAFARKGMAKQKDLARDRIVSLFKTKRWPGGLSILTMPGVGWPFENKLLNAREGNWSQKKRPSQNTHIYSIENDPALFAAAALSIPRGMNAPIVNYPKSERWTARTVGSNAVRRFHNCDLFNLIRHDDRAFDAAWIDLTGPLTPLRMELIREFYETRVAGILALTFLGARTTGETGVEIAECGGTPEWLRRELRGDEQQLFRYRDGASTMVQYVVARSEIEYNYDLGENNQWEAA